MISMVIKNSKATLRAVYFARLSPPEKEFSAGEVIMAFRD